MFEQLEFCLLDIKCHGSMTDRELKVSPGQVRAARPHSVLPQVTQEIWKCNRYSGAFRHSDSNSTVEAF